MPAHLVTEECYQQLIDSLQTAVPKSLSIIGSLRNALKGRLKANFYVDNWPEFKAVVCQYIWPRRSDVADIGAYATSSEALLSVLTEADLVTWGRRQEFQRIEDKHADYLLEHLRPTGSTSQDDGLKCIHERISVVLNDVMDIRQNVSTLEGALDVLADIIPEGYVLGRLKPHHAEMVASQWPRLHSWPNKEPYFRELIKSYFCPAIYSLDNFEKPASYIVQFPCNQTFGYTDEKHKGKHLVVVPGMYFYIFQLIMEGFCPLEEEASDPRRIPIFTKLNGSLSGYNVKDLATTNTTGIVDSKL